MFGIKIDAVIHIHHDDERLDRIDRSLAVITHQGAQIMSTTKELVDLANAAATEVGKFGPAVNALEAAITAALAKIPSIPPEAQADIDAAVATLQGAVAGAQTALADAADGVDEVVVPPAP